MMVIHFKQAAKRNAVSAFTLIEVLIGFFIFGVVTSGMIYGYVEANRVAEWSSQSLAAMSYAVQGMERIGRSAQWSAEEFSSGGAGITDVLGPHFQTNEVDTLDVPTSGEPIYATNYITSDLVSSNGAPWRQIVSQVVWNFRLTGALYTNTIVTWRAPDQLQ